MITRQGPVQGRWPKVAAVAAPLGTAACPHLRPDQRWLWSAWPVQLVHQVEEYVWPAGFLEWMNRDVSAARRRCGR